jgi:hypothetical protein
LWDIASTQTPPAACYNYPDINILTDCFLELGGTAGNCSFATPCGSFQEVIDANCTNVVVQPGLYNGVGNRGLLAGTLSNIRANGPIGSVVVDMELEDRFIRFNSDLTNDSISIVNMTIVNGFFSFNVTTAGGGAILIVARPYTFVNTQFFNNTIMSRDSIIADRTTRGGAFISSGSTGGSGLPAAVCGCTFENNMADAASNEIARGGAFVSFGYRLTAWGNAFRNNTAFSNNLSTGGAVHYNGITGGEGDLFLDRCNFCDNTAIHGGGGLYLVNAPATVVSNNVFLRNKALDGVVSVNLTAEMTEGGAIFDDTITGNVTYRNNIYRSNMAIGVNPGGAISLRNSFNTALSGGERFCNNTANVSTAIFTDDDIAYSFADSQFQCNDNEAAAIGPGMCTGGCVFLSSAGGNCSLCALPGFTCEALFVPPLVCIFFFSFLYISSKEE